MGRNTIILGVIAAGLLAFILLHERDMLSSQDLDQRKNRVLPSFVRDRVTRIELLRDGQSVTLERAPDPLQEGVMGPWRETAPMQVAADQEAVDILVGELEWLQPRRVFEDLRAEDQARFGFDKARIEVRYTVGKQRHSLLLGGEETTGLGLYARSDDEDVAYVVGKDLFEALDHDGGHFHTKELHKGVFVFAATAIVITAPDGPARAELRDGTWWAGSSPKSILSTTAVEEVVKGLDQLRAKRFVAAKITGPDSYGLANPEFALTVERKPLPDSPPDLSKPVTLRVGAVCGEHAEEFYIQVEQGPIMCAASEDLSKLRKSMDDLIERSPVPVDPSRLTEVVFENASQTITLTHVEERWRLRQARSGKPPAERDADREAVNEWLNSLRALQFVGRGEPGVALSGEPLATLEFKTSASKEAAAFGVRVTLAPDGKVHVLRDGETTTLLFDAAAQALLTPMAARFRSLEMVGASDASLTAVTVLRGTSHERVERVAGSWRLTQPIQADADPVVMSEVSHVFSGLSAVRFVADSPGPEHGLGNPQAQVVFTIGETERALLLGSATDGGIFAQLKGESAVFIVPTRVLETAAQGFLAKTSLAIPSATIQSVRFEQADGVREVRRVGQRFESEGVSDEVVAAQIERLARLRVESFVHFGPAVAAEQLERPRLSISVTPSQQSQSPQRDEPVKLVFGAQTGSEAAPQVYVRHSGFDATFTVPAAELERLKAWAP